MGTAKVKAKAKEPTPTDLSRQIADLASFVMDLAKQVAALVKVVLAAPIDAGTVVHAPTAPAAYPFWTRPSPNPRTGRNAGKAKTIQEIKDRALCSVDENGSAHFVFRGEDEVWAEVEAIKKLTPQAQMSYRKGLWGAFDPEVAMFLTLTNKVPARGDGRVPQWEEAAGWKPLDQYLSELLGIEWNEGQGPSGV